jgi:hypothetical protein
MLKETEAEATLENCRALINQITVGLSAEKPFVDFLSATEVLLYLDLPVLLSKSPHPSRESVGTRGSLSNISGTDGPAIHPARRIASRPSISSYGEETKTGLGHR